MEIVLFSHPNNTDRKLYICYIMLQHKRKYHYKGADTTSESRMFWLMVVIGLAIMAAIIFLL